MHRPMIVMLVCVMGCQSAPVQAPESFSDAVASVSQNAPAYDPVLEVMETLPYLETQEWTRDRDWTLPARSRATQQLSMASLKAEVTVQGRIARTEITHVIHNHNAWRDEGTMEVTLPRGASISRLAMDVEELMTEGELVAQPRANAIYEGIVRRRKDPAIMEWMGDNRYRIRLFPIPAHGSKTLILTYTQPLSVVDGQTVYVYEAPLLRSANNPGVIHNASVVIQADTEVHVDQDAGLLVTEALSKRVELGASLWRPSEPLNIRLSGDVGARSMVTYSRLGKQRYFMLDWVADLPENINGASVHRDGWVFAVDTSASLGERGLGSARALVQASLAELGVGASVQVVHGSIQSEGCLPSAEAGAIEALNVCLHGLTAEGASDVEGLLERAEFAARAMKEKGLEPSIVLLSDGKPSLGALGLDAFSIKLKRTTFPIHTVPIGSRADREWLDGVSRVSGGYSFTARLDEPVSKAAKRLVEATKRIAITDLKTGSTGRVEGYIFEKHGAKTSVMPGSRVLVVGRIGAGVSQIQMSGSWKGTPVHWTVPLQSAGATETTNPLVAHLWARKLLGRLEQQGAAEQAVRTSVEHGVLSRHTAFLVLEGEAAYRRFNVKRRKHAERRQTSVPSARPWAKTPVLPATQGKRTERPKRAAPQPSAKANTKVIPRGAGRKFPQVRAGSVMILGGLNKNIIRRVIRKHTNEIRYCFEQGLLARPDLGGRVAVEMVIEDEGWVVEASIRSSTLDSASVEWCILGRIRSWKFAAVRNGGIVRVVYPFLFANTSSQRAASRPITLPKEIQKELDALAEGRVIHDLLEKGNYDAAKAALEAFEQRSSLEHVVVLLTSHSALRKTFFDVFERAALATLKDKSTIKSIILAHGLIDVYAKQRQWSKLERVFGELRGLGGDLAGYILRTCRYRGEPDIAYRLFATWLKNGLFAPSEGYALLDAHPWLAVKHRPAFFAFTSALVEGGDQRPEVMDHYVRLGALLEHDTELLRVLEARCGERRQHEVPLCLSWLRGVSGRFKAKTLMARLQVQRVAQLQLVRRAVPGHPETLTELAMLLRDEGRGKEAALVLSEIVEFAPHEPQIRIIYAHAQRLVQDSGAPQAALR